MKVQTKDHRDAVSLNAQVCDRIYRILQAHKGKEKAITAKTISAMVNFPMEDTQVKCRTYIAKVMELYEVPVISCSKGYFIPKDQDEVSEYIGHMNSRISGMRATMEKVQGLFDGMDETEDE